MSERSPLIPQFAVLLSAVLWGTLWIPARRLHESAAEGAAWTAAGFALPLVALLPVAVARAPRTLAALRELAAAAFCLALAIALYVEGLTRGEVARVILLFYLTPVWSTLLARVMLGDPITGRRFTTLLLGLAGMFVIFGAGGGYPVPRSSADWMGLAAGLSWSLALVASRRGSGRPRRPIFDRLFVHLAFLAPVFVAVTQLPGSGAPATLSIASSRQPLVWVLAFGLVWMLPVMWLTLVGTSRVPPARFAILLMFEIVVGLASASWLTDEVLALRDYVGASLILSAIGIEIVPVRSRSDGRR